MSGREDTIITVVTSPLVKKEHFLGISGKQPEKSRLVKIEMRVSAILNLIRDNPSISRVDIAKKLGITDSQARTAIEKELMLYATLKNKYWGKDDASWVDANQDLSEKGPEKGPKKGLKPKWMRWRSEVKLF